MRFLLEDSLGFLLNRANNSSKTELANTFKSAGHDITPEQFGVMLALIEQDGMTQSELAVRLVKDKTNMTRIIDGMEKRQLIRRTPHESDRRSYRIYLSKKSLELKQSLIILALQASNNSTCGLSNQELKNLHYYLKAIYRNLQR